MTDTPTTRCRYCGQPHTRQSPFCSAQCEADDARFRAWDEARLKHYEPEYQRQERGE